MCGPTTQMYQRGTGQVRPDGAADAGLLRQVRLPDEHPQVHV